MKKSLQIFQLLQVRFFTEMIGRTVSSPVSFAAIGKLRNAAAATTAVPATAMARKRFIVMSFAYSSS